LLISTDGKSLLVWSLENKLQESSSPAIISAPFISYKDIQLPKDNLWKAININHVYFLRDTLVVTLGNPHIMFWKLDLSLKSGNKIVFDKSPLANAPISFGITLLKIVVNEAVDICVAFNRLRFELCTCK
jgi:hypothetical protein